MKLKAIRPNAGLRAWYRKRLQREVDAMHKSVEWWVRAAYRKQLDRIQVAQDAAPADLLDQVTRALRKRWGKRFDDLAEEIATTFAKRAGDQTDAAIQAALRGAGMRVKFTMNPAWNDQLQAVIKQNVSLIRSISSDYFDQIEGSVMRATQAGRDLGVLTTDLQKHYGVSYRRAAFIARDQGNKSTAFLNRQRQLDLQITEAVWVHSGGGKEPRPSHLKAGRDKVVYKIAEGWLDPATGKRIWPGTEINCLPADSPIEIADGVEVAYRRWYAGDLTQIVTATGKSLKATPNHPVLTNLGWKPIGLLNEGDYVAEIAEDGGAIFPRKEHIYDRIPMIVEVFGSLLGFGAMSPEIAVAGYFHGDVSDGDIDIVRAAWPLRLGAQMCKRGAHLHFSMSDFTSTCQRAAIQCFRRVSSSPASLMRRLCQRFSSLWAFALHPYFVGGASSAHFTAGRFDADFYGASRDAISFAESEEAFPSFMFATKFVRIERVKRESFAGHVYNLQTETGWYTSGGIIVHNCRCTSRSIIPELMTAKEAA